MGFEISNFFSEAPIGFTVHNVETANSGRFENALPWEFSYGGTEGIDTVLITAGEYAPGDTPVCGRRLGKRLHHKSGF